MSLQTKQFYEFSGFRLDPSEKVLLHHGKSVPLTPKVFETLKILVENGGHLIEKDELMRKIWQDRFVEENNLTYNVKMLRKALGDDASNPRFIETVSRRGYRFIAAVTEVFTEPESKNGLTQEKVLPPEENNFSVAKMSAAGKFPVLLVTFSILLAGIIFIILRSVRSKATDDEIPVLSASFDSEKLSTNGKVAQAVISPDGKNVVYTNSNGGKVSVWLRQIDSANNVQIVPASDDVYAGLAFSPDGNSIYLSRRPKGVEGQADIYRISIFGGVPTRIINQAQGWMSFSPDGAKISFVRCDYRQDEFCSLWIADAADGKNERKILSRPSPVRIGDNKFSPDGKTIAFAVGETENSANDVGLIEVNIETGTERELTAQKFFNIKSLEWLPNRRGLLITARKTTENNFRIWQISAADGATMPLTKDSETYSDLSLDTKADTIVSTQVKTDFHVFLQSLENPPDRRMLTDATAVAFTPQGKIVFSSPMTGNNQIWSINADGSGERQLTGNNASDSNPIVSPDSNSIYFSSNRTGEIQVWRMNSDGSNQTQVTTKEGGIPLFISADEHWVYYQSGLQKTLWRVSVEGGDAQLVLDKPKYRFAFSPDGTRIAFTEKQNEERNILIFSFANGQIVKTFKYPELKNKVLDISWTPDGKNLIYVSADSEDENNTLWIQPFDKETPQKIADLGDEMVNFFALAPDGKTFAIVEGSWKNDAILLKGLK